MLSVVEMPFAVGQRSPEPRCRHFVGALVCVVVKVNVWVRIFESQLTSLCDGVVGQPPWKVEVKVSLYELDP